MPDPEINRVMDYASLAEDTRQQIALDNLDDPLHRIESVYNIWWRWADFELSVVSPTIQPILPPVIILPECQPGFSVPEFVYPIYDFGYKLTTSKGQDMYTAGMSMCKLFYTIEKMIYLLVERLKTGGIDMETEVQVAFGGHEIAQRKAFESVINLLYNVVVTNFDPGTWGERYLQTVKRLADKGYGYPPETPREVFRQSHGSRTPSVG